MRVPTPTFWLFFHLIACGANAAGALTGIIAGSWLALLNIAVMVICFHMARRTLQIVLLFDRAIVQSEMLIKYLERYQSLLRKERNENP